MHAATNQIDRAAMPFATRVLLIRTDQEIRESDPQKRSRLSLDSYTTDNNHDGASTNSRRIRSQILARQNQFGDAVSGDVI